MKIRRHVIRTLCLFGLWAGLGLNAQAQTRTVHLYYTDPQGTPLVRTDAQGNILAQYDYTPYGSSVASLGAAPNGPGYTGQVNDPETGLVYMQARYYQPTGRFLSPDPVGSSAGNIYGFNRYAYANNNPIVNIDPDGRETGPAFAAINRDTKLPLVMHANGSPKDILVPIGLAAGLGGADEIVGIVKVVSIIGKAIEDAPQTTPKTDSNTNPYTGSVDAPVTVVDKDGNAIPVDTGQSIGASKNGDYQQVKGADGQPTGDRLDRGGHSTHSDPQSQQPHAHRPGVTDPNGNPHLPINPPQNSS